MSVVFVFNASLNDCAPISSMLFPGVLKEQGKSGMLMNFVYVMLHCCVYNLDPVQ